MQRTRAAVNRKPVAAGRIRRYLRLMLASRTALAALAFAALTAGAAAAQDLTIPESAFLEWRNLRMIISPEKEGTFVWVNSGYMKRLNDSQVFTGTFLPDEVDTWASDARWFLDQPIAATDTGTTRSSATLQGRDGRIYLVRRKHDGEWTKERFIVMESTGRQPVIVSGFDADARAILDSLVAVAHRAPAVDIERRLSLREMVEQSQDPGIDTPASANPDNRPPLYPEEERRLNHQGIVILSFVVDVDGKADMATVHVVHATSREFLKSTTVALQRLRFNPAKKGGAPARQLVIMPFQFSLMR
jgi:TonB family protein